MHNISFCWRIYTMKLCYRNCAVLWVVNVQMQTYGTRVELLCQQLSKSNNLDGISNLINERLSFCEHTVYRLL